MTTDNWIASLGRPFTHSFAGLLKRDEWTAHTFKQGVASTELPSCAEHLCKSRHRGRIGHHLVTSLLVASAVGGQFLIDAVSQCFECASQFFEGVSPERRHLAVRFALLRLQSSIGEGYENAFVPASNHCNQTCQTETEIFKDSVVMGKDWDTLERTILLALNVRLQCIARVNTFVDFNTGQAI